MAEFSKKTTNVSSRLRWGVEKRLEFIDFRLYWDGRINRADLTNFFEISVPQASKDLGQYEAIAPDNIIYDRSAKCYLATDLFTPKFIPSGSESYINELLSVDLGLIKPEGSYINNIPSFAFLPRVRRSIEPTTLFKILNAINNHLAIEIEYQSMSNPQPVKRWISPHALANDNYRWHIRAYCHEREGFRDFVFGRIVSFGEQRETESRATDDSDWNTYVTLCIGPNPKCSVLQQKATEYDYEMINGKAEIKVRIALLFYLLRTLGLSRVEQDGSDPASQHIILTNRDELQPILDNL